jgi:hypothetical protein
MLKKVKIMTKLNPKVSLFCVMLILISVSSFSQTKDSRSPDLRTLFDQKQIKGFNRNLTLNQEGSRVAVHLDEKNGDGLAWLSDFGFSNGTVEFDVKGKDVQGQSFVGLAFHGLNDSTYDAIYLRPFNFRAEDKSRKSHCVQYISHPTYTWFKLRGEFPGKYEQPIEPAPDPSSWVHVRVLVTSPKITVFINGNPHSSLTVEKLSKQSNGKIGFWVGNTSGGDFADIKITNQ